MAKSMSFGNPQIADKMAEKFGKGQELKVEMRYTPQVLEFIKKIETAHEEAAKSKLAFR